MTADSGFVGGGLRPEPRPLVGEGRRELGGGSDLGHHPPRSPAAPAVTPARPAAAALPAGGVVLATVEALDGYQVVRYLGLVDSQIILGANMAKDFFAGIRDMLGGRVTGYEQVLAKGRKAAMDEIRQQALQLGAQAVLGLHVQCETIQVEGGGSMLMVTATGTAAQIRQR